MMVVPGKVSNGCVTDLGCEPSPIGDITSHDPRGRVSEGNVPERPPTNRSTQSHPQTTRNHGTFDLRWFWCQLLCPLMCQLQCNVEAIWEKPGHSFTPSLNPSITFGHGAAAVDGVQAIPCVLLTLWLTGVALSLDSTILWYNVQIFLCVCTVRGSVVNWCGTRSGFGGRTCVLPSHYWTLRNPPALTYSRPTAASTASTWWRSSSCSLDTLRFWQSFWYCFSGWALCRADRFS